MLHKSLIISLLCTNFIFAQNKQSAMGGLVKNTQGLAVSNVIVRLKNTSFRTRTNENGYFQLLHIPTGNYVLKISGIGYENFQEKIQITEGQTVRLNLTIQEISILSDEVNRKTFPNLNGVGQLNEVFNGQIFSGKKNQFFIIDSLPATTPLTVNRQIFGRIPPFNFAESMDYPANQAATLNLHPLQSAEIQVQQNGYNINADDYGYRQTYFQPPIEAIERIEISRGNGSQLGDVLNYVLREATPGRPYEVNVQQTRGNFGLFNSYNSVGGTLGKFSYFTYLNYLHSDGWRPNSMVSQLSAFVKVAFQASSVLKLGLEYSFMRNKNQLAGGLTSEQWNNTPDSALPSGNWLSTPVNIWAFSADYRPSGSTSFTLKTTYLDNARQLIGRNYKEGLKGIDSTNYLISNRKIDQEQLHKWATDLRLLKSYRLGNKQSTLVTGISISYATIKRQFFGEGTAGNDFNFSIINPNASIDIDFITTNICYFIENVFNVTDKISVIPRINFEWLATTEKSTHGFDDLGFMSSRNKNISFVLPRIGIQYKISGPTNLYANLSQTYRPIDFSAFFPLGISLPSYDLKDSKGLTSNFGYRGIINNYLSFDMNVFYNFYENTTGLIRIENSINNQSTLRTNVGNSVQKGFDSYIDFNLTQFFNPHSRGGDFSIFYAFAYLDARYTTGTSNGKQVEYSPKFTNQTGILYRSKGLSTAFQWSYTTDAYADAANTTNRTNGIIGIIPAYQVFDWSANYRFKTYNFKGGVNNIADAKYFTRLTEEYPKAGIIPAVGRNFYVSFGVKF